MKQVQGNKELDATAQDEELCLSFLDYISCITSKSNHSCMSITICYPGVCIEKKFKNQSDEFIILKGLNVLLPQGFHIKGRCERVTNLFLKGLDNDVHSDKLKLTFSHSLTQTNALGRSTEHTHTPLTLIKSQKVLHEFCLPWLWMLEYKSTQMGLRRFRSLSQLFYCEGV